MPSLSSVNGYDYALIALYFGIVIFVGWYSSRKNATTDDYFKGGGKIPWPLAGVSNFVSGFSAWMFVGAAGFTYKYGLAVVPLFTSAFWAYLLGALYFAPRWRRARLGSPLEFLTRRYSPSTTYFYSVTAVVPQVIGIGQGLYVLCIFVSSVLGFAHQRATWLGLEFSGLELTMLAVGVVMIVYTVIGGLWAAVLSDAVQGVIVFVTSLIVLPVTFLHLGAGGGIGAGISRVVREAPADFLTLHGRPVQPLFLGAFLISSILGYNVAWWQVQRYQSVPDERGARKMALLCAALCAVGPLLWILPVIGARVIFPDLAALWPNIPDPTEASFASVALLLLPHGMIGFVVAAILSATLGQASDGFNWLAATITRDVYLPLRKRFASGEPTERHLVFFAQGTMLAVGGLGIWAAFKIARTGGAFDFGLKYYSIIAPGFMMPVLLGMIYRRTPWWSGIATCLAAFGASFALLALDWWPEYYYERNMFSAVIASVAVFAGSAFFYRKDDVRSRPIEALDRDLRTPVPSEGDPGAGGLRDFAMLAGVATLLGATLIACWFLPAKPPASPLVNIAGGLVLLIIAGLLWRVSRPRA